MRTGVSGARRRGRGATLLELYTDAPNSPRFLSKIQRKETLDIIAKIAPESNRLLLSGSNIITGKTNARPRSVVEMKISEAAMRTGFSLLYQPVPFYIESIGRICRIDLGLNAIIRERGENDQVTRNKILMIEAKGFEHIRGKEIHGDQARQKFARQKELLKVRKMEIMHQENPRVFLVLMGDMNAEKLQKEFGIKNMNSLCDRYIEMPRAFDKPDNPFEAKKNMEQLKKMMKELKRIPGARIERDKTTWYGIYSDIVRQQLSKMVG
ncbi:MAG: hypothetical protein KGH61_02715 [Candidatus Micrarchaeota archaeon]|nr:hypothetical protein [Candidatus Micrarchaeota archaeon]MDE1847837.1 hypothetical protein [Candidatus Micrarchaeota archaeon]MDE1864357.1 hypothetical protein [Candidatus Micrarchaeota archaeon]